MSRLFIRIRREAEQVGDGFLLRDLEWVLLDEAGELVSRGVGDGSALVGLLGTSAAQDPDSVVVLIPTELCLSLECSVPGRTAGQVRRALPFVVEEFLAVDVETLHLALGPVRRGKPVACLAVDRAQLEGWLAALRRIGLVPGHCIPDALLLPTAREQLTLLFDDAEVLVRTPRQALSADSEQVSLVLSGAISELAAPIANDGRREPEIGPSTPAPALAEVTVMAINGRIDGRTRLQVEQSAECKVHWVEEETELTSLMYLAQAWRRQPPPVDLLQGAFAPPRRANPVWQRWRAVAVLAGVWIGLALATEVARGAWASYRAEQLAQEQEALYRAVFPAERRVVDPRRQMAVHLGQATAAGPGFLDLLGRFGRAVAADKGAELMSVGFADSRGELTADLALGGYDALDALKKRLESGGVQVQIASAEQQEGRVRARLRMSAA